jgi:gluconolactonase
MTVTTDGLIVAAAGSGARGGVYVITPEGKVLATIPTPESPTNVEFGGADRKTLYVTAGKSLYRIHTTLTGFHLWPRGE